MNPNSDVTAKEEYEPIELGSVSEETKGGFYQGAEFASGMNSRLVPIA
ncbi:MAG: hypothetical protein V7675_14090 [Hyphomonas sp.]|tara:strand:- start:854 stop:997 length:144 start_codon:yes stop_codon:yes gene_type:complete